MLIIVFLHMEINKVENHPFVPFIPDGAKILFLGTFPPKQERWSIHFYYPNYINDFYRIVGLLFYNDKDHFCIPDLKKFNLPLITDFLKNYHIAIYDTATKVIRLKDNASDKFLEIKETVNLYNILDKHPDIHHIVTTGEKAASVIAEITSTPIPAMGESVNFSYNDTLYTHSRMPSTSRAYPMKLEKKAEYYKKAFENADIPVLVK